MLPSDFNCTFAVTTVAEIDALPADAEAVLVRGISDDLACALGRFDALRFLYTDGNVSVLTDRGLQALSQLVSLESLDLVWSVLSDAGLHHLRGLTNLRWLDLGFPRGISTRGLATLRLALPDCEINTDGAWLLSPR